MLARPRNLTLAVAACAAFAAFVAAEAGDVRADSIVGGAITEDTTWHLRDSPILVTENVTISGYWGGDGVTTLTVEAGVEVRFLPGKQLTVGGCCGVPGALVANGSASQGVVFTSSNVGDLAEPGDWGGLHFLPSADDEVSELRFATVAYAGGDGRGAITADDAAPGIVDSIVRDSAAYGVYGAGPWAAPRVERTSFIANAEGPVRTSPWGAGALADNDVSANGGGDVIEVYGGRVEAATQWDDPGAPFIVLGDVTVTGDSGPNGVTTLTVGPGVEVRFEQGVALFVGECCDYRGALASLGTVAEPVLFTSAQPAGGKTAGYWDRVYFHRSTNDLESVLRNTTFEFGGATGQGLVHVLDSAPTFYGGAFRSSTKFGIFTEGVSALPTVAGATFADNGPAHVVAQPNGAGLLTGNSFPTGGEIRVLSGTVSRDSEWTDQGVPFNVTGDLTVSGFWGDDGRTSLTFRPGVEARFAPEAILGVTSSWTSGFIVAQGSSQDPVLLTSQAATKAPGQWGGVFFGRDAYMGSWRHVIVEAAGDGLQGALEIEDDLPVPFAAVTVRQSASRGIHMDCPNSEIEDVLIQDAATYGLYQVSSSSYCRPTLTRVTIETSGDRPARLHMETARGTLVLAGNAVREVELFTSDLFADATLERLTDRDDGEHYPYALLSSFTVRSGATLTVDPGVTLRFAPSTELRVGLCCSSSSYYRGTLVAAGTEDLPIVFDSLVNADRWYGAYLEGYGLSPDPDHVLRNVTFTRSRDDGLHMRRMSAGTFDNVTVSDNDRHGLYLQDRSDTTWRNLNALDNAGVGVYVDSYTVPVFIGGVFASNVGHGIYLEASNGSVEIRGSTFRDNRGRPARVRFGDTVADVTVSGDDHREFEMIGYNQYGSRTLTPIYDAVTGERYAYRLLGSSTIRNDAVLTLEPGVTMRFSSGVALNFGICCSSSSTYRGTLIAAGTSADPVRFEGAPGGTWAGIYLEGYGLNPDPDHVLRNVTVRDSSDDGLHLRRTAAGTFDNVTLEGNGRFGLFLEDDSHTTWDRLTARGNGDHGVYLNSQTVATFNDATFADNAGRGILIPGTTERAHLVRPTFDGNAAGTARIRFDDTFTDPAFRNGLTREIELWGVTFTSDITLDLHADEGTGAPYAYAVLSDTNVWDGWTLTVAPGVSFVMADQVDLNIGRCCSNTLGYRGALIAEGTEAAPIRFANRTALSSSSWGGVHIEGGTAGESRMPSILRNVTSVGSRDHAITILRTEIGTFDNLTVGASRYSGLRVYQATVDTHGLTSTNNQQNGVVVENGATLNAANVTILDNTLDGVRLIGTNTATFTGGIIRGSGNYGVHADADGGRVDLTGISILESGGRPWRVNAHSVMTGVSLGGNGIKDLEWRRADVAGNRSWPLMTDGILGGTYTYTVIGGLSWYDQSTLTIGPGVTVRFAENTWLDIGRCCYSPATRGQASLVAAGTLLQPITFEALSGKADGWYGMYANGDAGADDMPVVLRNITVTGSKNDAFHAKNHDNVTLDRVTLGDSTRFGLYVQSSGVVKATDLVVEDVDNHGIYTDSNGDVDAERGTIRRTAGHAIYHYHGYQAGAYRLFNVEDIAGSATARVRVDTDLTGFTATNSAERTIEMHAADVRSDRTFSLITDTVDGGVYKYRIFNSFTVWDGATLTIPGGSHIVLDENDRIHVGRCCYHDSRDPGALQAIGTAATPITFGATVGNKVDGWKGLYFDGRSNYGELTSTLRHVILEDSKADLVETRSHSSVVIDDVTFRNATGSGLYHHGAGGRTVTDSVFDGGTRGIYGRDSAVTVRDSVFENATTNAMYLYYAHNSVLEDNTFSTANVTGVRLYNSDNSDLKRNKFEDNALGLWIQSNTGGTDVIDNLFRNIANVDDDASNTVYSQAATVGTNICGGPRIAGNCWSDYDGEDTDDDGIGDTLVPYTIGINGAGDPTPIVARPFADFTYEVVNATQGLIQFTDASTDPVNAIVNWSWTFDDGGSSFDQDPLHAYSADGLYNVRLVIENDIGVSVETTKAVLLDSLPPVSEGELTGTLGQAGWWVSNVTVTLNASDAESAIDVIMARVDPLDDFAVYDDPLVLSTEGEHQVEYYAVDLGGNEEVVRTLEVPIDLNAPVTSPLLTGTLHDVGWFTTNVTASLEAADTASGAVATYFRLDGGDLTSYTGGIPIQGTGEHTLDPLSEDVAGNLEDAVRHLVRIDLHAPTSTVTVEDGVAGTNGWWRSPVNVTLDGGDLGAGVALLQLAVGDDPLATYSGPVALATDGIHTVSHRATDLVDRVEALAETLVSIDQTLPTIDVDLHGDLHPTGWYDAPVVMYVTGSDLTSGVAATEYRLNSPGFRAYTAPVIVGSTGTHTFAARVLDVAGNIVTDDTLTLPVDVTPPRTTRQTVSGVHGSGNWYRSDVVSRLSTTDGAGSGVASTTFSVDDGPSLPYVPGSDITLTGEGVHTIAAAAEDLVGHVEALRTFAVGIDVTAPTATSEITGVVNETTGAYFGATTVRLIGADALSGVTRLDYWVNGAGPYRLYGGAGSFVLDEAGVFNITFRALDRALNVGPLETLDIELDFDLDPPVSFASFSGVAGTAPWYRSAPEITLSATDIGAGVGFIDYKLNDAENWTRFDGTFTVAEEGLHTLAFRAVDLVGNEEVAQVLTFGVDLTAPVTSVDLDGATGNNGWFSGPVDATLGGLDTVSGVKSLVYRVNGGPWEDVSNPVRINTSGVFTLDWVATDYGGNPTEDTVTVKVDFDLPVGVAELDGVVGNDTAWWASSVTVTLDATDPTSGVLGLEFSLDGGAWVPYVGPINITGEGAHHLLYAPLDLVGNRGLEVGLDLNIDLTSPIANLSLDEELFLLIDETITVRNRLCIHLEVLDLVSGLNELTMHIVGVVSHIIKLDLGVNYQCVDLPDGEYELNLIGCDRAGWCTVRPLQFRVDNLPPFIDLVRPTPGSVMVQNVSAPIFRTLFDHERVLLFGDVQGVRDVAPVEDPGVPGWPDEAPVAAPAWPDEAPVGDPREGPPERPEWPEDSPLRDPEDGDHLNLTVDPRDDDLAKTTVVVGPRVPIWIRALDTSGVAEVTFLLDGVPVAKATRSEDRTLTTVGVEQRDILDENLGFEAHLHQVDYDVYVLVVDTLRLVAGQHNVTVQARDVLGSESSRTFSFIFEGAQHAGSTGETLADIVSELAVPPQLWQERAYLADSIRYLAPLIDKYAERNYVYLDEGLLEHAGAYGPVQETEGVAYADEGWSI